MFISRVKPQKFFAKKVHLEKHLKEGSKETIQRAVFGPHFGIRDEHVTKLVEALGEELLVLELGCAESGNHLLQRLFVCFIRTNVCPLTNGK